jgi:DNA helicase-2/ATP-dependent DNA helicase PcrA
MDLKNQQIKEIDLNDIQREAVDYNEGPLLITAGAGSGKTRTLTQRILKLIEKGVNPERIVAITFTNKAANEIKRRIELQFPKNSNGKMPFLGTFHSFGARILRKEAFLLNRTPEFIIFDSDDSLRIIKKILKSLDLPVKDYPPAKIQNKISKIKNDLLPKEELDEELINFLTEYENSLERQNAFDFDDLIEKTVFIFKRYPEVLSRHQNLFEYILVDEYQDINTSQYCFVKMLADKHKNINVVGDDQQSIYKFRGSDFRNFLNFEKDWPNAKIINLGENYRSSGNIVRASAEVIKNNKFQRHKKLWTSNKDGSPIKIFGTVCAEEEANLIVDLLVKKLGDLKSNFRSAAILYRTNSQSRAIEQALNFNSIPYEIFGGIKFYERKEIKDIVAGLRYGLNPKDEVSLERLDKTFRKAQFKELEGNLPALAKNLNIIELIGYFLKTTDYQNHLVSKFPNIEERMENIKELISFGSSFDSLPEFIERISLLQSTDKVTDTSKRSLVKLMTIHLAKGLEFDDVHIAGATENILPHQRSLQSEEELEEERRLMYVAMTRARNNLTLSFYGFASRFLYEIPPEIVEFSNRDQWENENNDEDAVYLD